ncbi:hypothetical protein AAFF_G00390650 [Aldrovandia affinis]|uniref:Uncharacterized protein n=1 Tax=Aldrovandia affinis TaxID=143900 RepID=A0AAD7R3Z0_9TELE|nr:hypothetical protein AAFF_G00390650 [Aldrovandia affinis]
MCRRTAKGGGVFHCTYHPNRTQQYRDRRGNPGNARGGPLNCPFGNRLCEYGVKGGAGWECWNYHPLASKLVEDPRFRAGYVGDSPNGGDWRQRDEEQ